MGENSEKDQFGEGLDRGKEWNNSRYVGGVWLYMTFMVKEKQASVKGGKGKNKHEFREGIPANNQYTWFYE